MKNVGMAEPWKFYIVARRARRWNVSILDQTQTRSEDEDERQDEEGVINNIKQDENETRRDDLILEGGARPTCRASRHIGADSLFLHRFLDLVVPPIFLDLGSSLGSILHHFPIILASRCKKQSKSSKSNIFSWFSIFFIFSISPFFIFG